MISNRIVTCSIYYRETLKQIKHIKKKMSLIIYIQVIVI